MDKHFGWTGSVLHIDLTTGKTRREHPDPALYEMYLGGRGMAGQYLRPHATREYTDPLLPLLIFTGPLTATDAPTSGIGSILSRSPLTGAVCDDAVGGSLATQLKRAGYDGLVITGRSKVPCGIEIRGTDIRVVETSLWGKTTGDVFTALAAQTPKDGTIACIGPAAENGSRLASIVVDRHYGTGRGGLGLILAAKNCKYLTINGTGTVRVHDQTALAEAHEEILRLSAASPVLMGQHGFSHWGTGALFDLIDARRMMPTENFTKTRFENAPKLNAAAYKQRFSPHSHGCSGCHILCRQVAGDGRALPEFETMSHFTALIGNTDPEQVLVANNRCGQLGLDPISAGVTLACRREISGQDYTPATLLTALDEMAEGGDLGQGAQMFAQACDAPETAMTVKGLELPAYDPRGAYGLALAYAVSTAGGCLQHASPLSHEILRKPVATDRFSFSGKARIIKIAEDANAVADSLAACKFIFLAASLEEYTKAFNAVTGLNISGQALLEIGERINYNERLMNAENGFSAEDDDLPDRFFSEPGTSGGGVTIAPIDREEFLAARANYYKIRGLDRDGRPTREMTAKLGLGA